MILKDSRPNINKNSINDNDGIGLYIRDKSNGIIKDNHIQRNEIELVVEKKNVFLANIKQENDV
jgi:F-box protein 11